TNTTRLAYYVPDSANQNSSLTMINNVLIPFGGSTLSFLTLQNLEDGFDKVYVEVSTDNGVSFNPAGAFMNDFVGTRIIDISQYAGRLIKLRFRMVSDLLNGPPDATPLGWYVQDIRINSDDFHTIASPGPTQASLSINGRPNGTYYYRVAGLFSTPLGNAPGPYSESPCVTVTIGVPYITSLSLLANGHALLNCLGQAGVAHRIQGAADLHTWSDL